MFLNFLHDALVRYRGTNFFFRTVLSSTYNTAYICASNTPKILVHAL